MTITTEEAEWLAQQHDLARFTLGMKAPEHDLTAATIRSLAAERDALQARVVELEGALRAYPKFTNKLMTSQQNRISKLEKKLRDMIALATECSGLAGRVLHEPYVSRIAGAEAALEGKKDE